MRIEISRHQFGWEYEITICPSEDRLIYTACNFDSIEVATKACYEKLLELNSFDQEIAYGIKSIEECKNNLVTTHQHHISGKWKFSVKISDLLEYVSFYDYLTEINALNAGIKELSSLFMIQEEKRKETFDFGNGPVAAHKHPNGGGWVANTTKVAETAFVGPDAKVYGSAHVQGFARICDNAQVYDYSYVFDNALIRDDAKVFKDARVYDRAIIENVAQIYGHAEVFGDAKVLDLARVYDFARIYCCARVFNCAQVFGHALVHDNALVYQSAKVSGELLNDARAYRSVLVKDTFTGNQNAHES